MTIKEKYKEFCLKESSMPLFSKGWWLDSVAGDCWNVVLVEKGGEIVASMPYVIKRRYGFSLLTQPPLTQVLGPWFKSTNAKYSSRLSIEKELMDELIAQLPKYSYFCQNWHYSNQNWLPFYWKGFEQTTRYTYVINYIKELESVWNGFSSSYRNKIKKAQKSVEVKSELPIRDFYKINTLTFMRQGLGMPYTYEFLKHHDEVLKDNNARKIFYAVDKNHKIHSALYLTWDAMSSYVHMVGEDPELRSSGAGILLIWEAIKFTANELQLDTFDFEGSMIERVERVRRDCGGIQKTYHSIRHTPSKILQLVNTLHQTCK